MPHLIRRATLADFSRLETLVAQSIRKLGAQDYTSEQIESALKGAFGVDTQLIQDGTYFVVEAEGHIVGCGGWSRRRTLFGGDSHTRRDASELNPKTDAAKIRVFFVAPSWTRRGIGASILQHCEAEAVAHGFSRFELVATLPGVRLYSAYGYLPGAVIHHNLAPGLTIPFVPMFKDLHSRNRAEVQQGAQADSPASRGPAA